MSKPLVTCEQVVAAIEVDLDFDIYDWNHCLAAAIAGAYGIRIVSLAGAWSSLERINGIDVRGMSVRRIASLLLGLDPENSHDPLFFMHAYPEDIDLRGIRMGTRQGHKQAAIARIRYFFETGI